MRAMAMSIAGFDPSGGAGILADIKTFEQVGVMGFGVCTAITVQSDDCFISVDWLPVDMIIAQAETLLSKFNVTYCKIGLIENFQSLSEIIAYLNTRNIKIILDPILKASAGFDFHKDSKGLLNLLKSIYLLTPNADEYHAIFGGIPSADCHIYLKGGHNKEHLGVDLLQYKNAIKPHVVFPPKNGDYFPKHGSGCVLSAAITGYLAKGYGLEEACRKGKTYISRFLQSNPSLLGYHSEFGTEGFS